MAIAHIFDIMKKGIVISIDHYQKEVAHASRIHPRTNFIEAKEVTVATSLNRFNKLPSATITASMSPDYSMDEAIEFFTKTTREVSKVADIDYTGATRLYMESSSSIYYTFLISCLIKR